MIIEIFATTDNGQRYGQNEDNFAVCKDLATKSWVFKPQEKVTLSEQGAVMLVADGMGGANAGEVASDLAQKVVQAEFNQLLEVPGTDKEKIGFLKKVIQTAHETIVAHQVENLDTAGMGTTIVVLWATPDKAYVAWCGDSRLYIHKKGIPLKPATDDHSYVWELVKQGKINPKEARLHPESNIITQSLGDHTTPPKPEFKMVDLQEGDRFLLCSDGLNSMLDDEQIEAVLNQEDDTVEASKKLIAAANAAGGHDNITVVLFDVREVDLKPATAPARTTTQELRKFIQNRNKVIALLSFLLVCVLGYVVAGFIPSRPTEKPIAKELPADASLIRADEPNPDSLAGPISATDNPLTAPEVNNTQEEVKFNSAPGSPSPTKAGKTRPKKAENNVNVVPDSSAQGTMAPLLEQNPEQKSPAGESAPEKPEKANQQSTGDSLNKIIPPTTPETVKDSTKFKF